MSRNIYSFLGEITNFILICPTWDMYKATQPMIGDTLKELREKNDLLQREVGAALNIDAALVSKMEKGVKFVSRDYLERLATLFQMDIRELEIEWLASKLIRQIENEPLAELALVKALDQIKQL